VKERAVAMQEIRLKVVQTLGETEENADRKVPEIIPGKQDLARATAILAGALAVTVLAISLRQPL
jgi:hypothetical protein